MSLLPNATFINPLTPFYGTGGGGGGGIDWSIYPAIAPVNLSGYSIINGNALEVSTINTSTINANIMQISTINVSTITANALQVSTLNVSTINTNSLRVSTINTSTINASTIFGNTINVSTVNTSTINTNTVDLDGQLLTANPTNLLLNGVPIATVSQLSNVADWSLYPSIGTGVDMANLPISNATAIELNGATVTTGLLNTLQINGTNPVASWANYGAISSFSMNYYDIANISSATMQTLKLLSTTGIASGNLTTNSNGSALFLNDSLFPAGNTWSLYPALSSIDCRTFSIDNIGSLTCAGAINYAIFGSVGKPMLQMSAIADVVEFTTTSAIEPLLLDSGQDIKLNAVGEITLDTAENISITSGNNLNLEGNDLNLTQNGVTSVLNMTATGAITITSLLGIIISATTTIQIVSPGNISIGSGNVAGADTEIEKVGFLDNKIYPAGGSIFDLQISGVQIVENLGNSMRVQAESSTSDNIGLKLITLDRASGSACCKISLADDNRVILGDTGFTAPTTTLEFDVTGPFVGKMQFNGAQFSLDTQLNMSSKNLLGVASLTATNIVDSTASTGSANQVLSAGVAGGTLAWVTAPNSGFTPFTSLTATAGSVNIPLSYVDSITYYLQDGTNPSVTVLIVSDSVGFIDLPPGSSFTLAINPNTPTPTAVTVSVTTLAFPTVFNDLFTITYPTSGSPNANTTYRAMKVAFGGDATSWVYMKTT